MALTKIGTDGFKDDAVTADKLANAINTERTANTAKVSTTINNNADNRVITGSGTANTLNGESTVVVDANGNLGIGTTSPSGKLNLATGASAACELRLTSNNTGSGSGDRGRLSVYSSRNDGTAFEAGKIEIDRESGTEDKARIQLFTNGGSGNTERMRIDSSGRVLIGTDTVGDANGDDLTVAGSGHSGITIRSGTSSTSQLMFTDSTSGAGSYTGIVAYRHASDSMGFFTNTGERLTINSSGQVSIGTTTASSDTDTKLRVHVPISSSTDDVIELSHNTNGANKAGASFGLSIANGGEATNAADLTFSTASGGSLGERMRLNSNGALCIGTTSEHNTGKKLAISSTDHAMEIQITDSNNVRCITLRHGRASGGTGGEQITFENSDGSSVGTIESTGSATSFNTSSDYRLKENITAISDGITRLKTLKPSRFNFKVDKDTTVDGFLAHEVTAVPEAIKGTKDEVATTDDDAIGLKKGDPIYQRIDHSKLVPLLTAALQEAVSKIEVLETKVAALEAA